MCAAVAAAALVEANGTTREYVDDPEGERENRPVLWNGVTRLGFVTCRMHAERA